MKQTGEGIEAWGAKMAAAGLGDQRAIRAWLAERGITGYLQMFLVWERLGYPDFISATADELVDAQYADRTDLRPIYDAVIEAAVSLADVTVQTRKTYVSLVTPRRTFVRVQATTRKFPRRTRRRGQGVAPGRVRTEHLAPFPPLMGRDRPRQRPG